VAAEARQTDHRRRKQRKVKTFKDYTFKSQCLETGESGASFGGPIGAPPPGFSEAFGLNGASVPLDEIMPKEHVMIEPPTTTTRKPK
jgi:hypothetical protein